MKYFENSFQNVIPSIIPSLDSYGVKVVISAVTYADKLLAEPEWFKPGTLLVPIHTRGFQNCDAVFDKVVVDDIGHVQGFQHFNEFKGCCELSEVILKEKSGRTSNKERIIAYNVGTSIQDIYFAKKIYDLCVKKKDIDYSISLPQYWA